jgi:uncharacterized phiE125 gp8 family phage protein
MPYKVTVQPTSEPITLPQAKRHLRVDWADDDAYINDLITAARQWCENGLRRALITQTLQAVIQLPEPVQGKLSGVVGRVGWPIELPMTAAGTLQSVTLAEIETQIATFASLTVTDDYLVDPNSEPGRIWLAAAAIAEWSVSLNYPGAVPRVRVTYTAGYGADASTVPYPIKQAIMNGIAHLYENREAGGAIPDSLLPMQYKVWRL